MPSSRAPKQPTEGPLAGPSHSIWNHAIPYRMPHYAHSVRLRRAPCLPSGLLHAVFDLLSEEILGEAEQLHSGFGICPPPTQTAEKLQEQLAHLVLVCRSWASPALKALYSNPVLKSRRQLQSFCRTLSYNEPRAKTLQRLLRVLIVRPSEEVPLAVYLMLANIVLVCTSANLRAMEPSIDDPNVLRTFAPALDRLTYLLLSKRADNKSLTKAISTAGLPMLTRLRKLTLQGDSIGLLAFGAGTLIFPNLTQLNIVQGPDGYQLVPDIRISHSSFSQLKSLGIFLKCGNFFFDDGVLQTLEHLTVPLRPWGPTLFKWSQPLAVSDFSVFSSLVHLQLLATCQYPPVDFDTLPRNLGILHVRLMEERTTRAVAVSSLAHALSEARALTLVKKLELSLPAHGATMPSDLPELWSRCVERSMDLTVAFRG